MASHTKDAILSAAAFADFQGEVAKQLHEGNQAGAEGLWLSAVEILHKPWFLAPTAKPSGLPPLRFAPCMAVPCTRCDQGRGGFQFPWLGSWTRRACMPVPGSEPDAAWQRLLTQPEKMDKMLQLWQDGRRCGPPRYGNGAGKGHGPARICLQARGSPSLAWLPAGSILLAGPGSLAAKSRSSST